MKTGIGLAFLATLMVVLAPGARSFVSVQNPDTGHNNSIYPLEDAEYSGPVSPAKDLWRLKTFGIITLIFYEKAAWKRK